MLTVHLFGKLQLENDQQTPCDVPGGKAQELFCYLLLHRHGLQAREAVATLLWPDCETAKSKKSLRQVLWQLQRALNSPFKNWGCQPLTINSESIALDGDGSLTTDVELFEKAYREVRDLAGQSMDPAHVRAAQLAVDLYRGDLLEGCYQDWCLLERERLQNCYLSLLDKLICHCQNQGDYRRGIDYGERVLRLDRAHERSHQHLMWLHYLNGDRTAALRQYERCRAALQEELGVEPSWETKKLSDQLRADLPEAGVKSAEVPSMISSSRVVHHLQHLLTFINKVETQVKKEIHTAKQAAELPGRRLQADSARVGPSSVQAYQPAPKRSSA